MSSLPDDPPTWDWRDDVAFKALRRDAVWDEADLLLATRAWARTALVVSWLTAVGTATGWRTAAWGLLTLVGVLISVVHADRAAVQAVAGRLGRSWPRLARVWTWFFRYPDFAHVNPVGFVEVPSLLAVALVTGALPGDSLVKVVAIGLVMPLVSLAVANMAAHPLWHLDAPPALVRLRPLLGPLFFVIAFVTVWRPADAPAVQLAAVLGGALGAGSAYYGARILDGRHRAQAAVVASARRIVLRDAAALLHAVGKNRARRILAELHQLPGGQTRDLVRYLCQEIVALERQFNGGAAAYPTTAVSMTASIAPGSLGRQVRIIDDIDVPPLPQDARLAFVVLSDLLTNALTATGTGEPVDVAFTHHAGRYRVAITCRCGGADSLRMPTPGSSLWRLAELLEQRGGTLEYSGDARRHTYTATWAAGL